MTIRFGNGLCYFFVIGVEGLAAVMADQGLSGDGFIAGGAGLGHSDRQDLRRAKGGDRLGLFQQTEGDEQAEEPDEESKKKKTRPSPCSLPIQGMRHRASAARRRKKGPPRANFSVPRFLPFP